MTSAAMHMAFSPHLLMVAFDSAFMTPSRENTNPDSSNCTISRNGMIVMATSVFTAKAEAASPNTSEEKITRKNVNRYFSMVIVGNDDSPWMLFFFSRKMISVTTIGLKLTQMFGLVSVVLWLHLHL